MADAGIRKVQCGWCAKPTETDDERRTSSVLLLPFGTKLRQAQMPTVAE